MATSPFPVLWDRMEAAVNARKRRSRRSRCSETAPAPARTVTMASARTMGAVFRLADEPRQPRGERPDGGGQKEARGEGEREAGGDVASGEVEALDDRRTQAAPRDGVGQGDEDLRDGELTEVLRREQPGENHHGDEGQQRLAARGQKRPLERGERA